MVRQQSSDEANGLQPNSSNTFSLLPVHTDFHQPNVLVPPNPYLSMEIPYWLKVYCNADPALDRELKWDLFDLEDLNRYDVMMQLLCKTEMEAIVMK